MKFNLNLFQKSFNTQQVLLKDERHLSINEKTSTSVSKIMNWLMILLLFFTGVVIKNTLCLLLISLLTIIKLILTIFYSYYYSHKL